MTDFIENTMVELESILNDLEPDASRLRAFLNHKTSRKPKNNQQFLLAVPDISFDIGVDLVRHPTPKETIPEQSAGPKNGHGSCDPVEQDRVVDSQPQHENGRTFPMALQRSLSLSPSIARRRVCRSPLKKCTRTTVLKNSNDEFISTPSPMSFEPAVSSTPALVSKPSEKQSPKAATSVMTKNGQPLTADDFENSYLGYMMSTKGINQLPLSPPKFQKQSKNDEQDMPRSFNLENGRDSSHLKATQGEEKSMRRSKLEVRLKRISPIKKVSVIETAMELDKSSGTEQEDKLDSVAVPDPVCELQEKLVPANLPPDSPPALSAASPPATSDALPAKSQALSSVLPTISHSSPPKLPPEPMEKLVPEALGSALKLTEVVSAPPSTSTSCGIQTSCLLSDTPQQKEGAGVLIPVNLESLGGDKATKQQLQTQTVNESGSDDDELVLDLHNYRHENPKRAMTTRARAKSVLNKPSCPEINGQEFAKELAKMSNYEIVDLRKRNSQGLFNGQLSEDQQIVEEKIKEDILRRKSEENESSNNTVNKKRGNLMRSVRMTQELMDYMSLSRTIKLRMKNSNKSCSKRSLYTKGDSDNELSSPSPKKQARLCDSAIQIASAPPSVSLCTNDVTIAPAPPASMRFSQQISTKEKTSITFQKEPAASLEDSLSTPSIDALPIVPPPPVSLRFSQLMPSKVKLVCGVGKDVSDQPVVYLEQPAVSLEDPSATRCIDSASIVEPPSVTSNCNSGKDFPDQLACNAVEEPQLAVEENTVEAEDQSISEHMEPLRVQSISPPPLDDQPSTSHAARAAFERSLNKKPKTIKKTTNKKTLKDDVFKPPCSSRVPRAKKKKKEEEENDNITIRKSKRGQMPLRNDFCHTLSDPFSFMRETYLGSAGAADSKTLKRKRKASSYKRVEKPVKEQAPVSQDKKKRPGACKEQAAVMDPEQLAAIEPEQVAAIEPEQVEAMEPEQFEESQPLNEISPVFSWLRGVSNIAPKPMKQVSPAFESMCISPAADLNFISLENIDYAFYITEESCTLGYMRLQPYQQRGFKRNKTNSLYFVAIYGKFGIEVQKAEAAAERYVISTGDMVDIKIGCRFNIVNRLNEVGLLLVNRLRGPA